MPDTHEVLRAINGTDVQYQPGDRVDASNWKWREHLVEMRRLRPLPAVVVAQVETPHTQQQKRLETGGKGKNS